MAGLSNDGGAMPQNIQSAPAGLTQLSRDTIAGATFESTSLPLPSLSENNQFTLRDGRVVTITSSVELMSGKLYQEASSPSRCVFIDDKYLGLQLLADKRLVDANAAFALENDFQIISTGYDFDPDMVISENGVVIPPYGVPQPIPNPSVTPESLESAQIRENSTEAHTSITSNSTPAFPSSFVAGEQPEDFNLARVLGFELPSQSGLGTSIPNHTISAGDASHQGQGLPLANPPTTPSGPYSIKQPCEHPECSSQSFHDIHHIWDHQNAMLDDIALIPNDVLKGPSAASKAKKAEGNRPRNPPEAPRKNFFDARYLPIPSGSVSLTMEEITQMLGTNDSKIDRVVPAYDEEAEGVPDDWELIKEHLAYNIQKLLLVCERDPRDQPFDRAKDLEGKYFAVTDPDVMQCHLTWQQNAIRGLLRGLHDHSKKYRFARAHALLEALITAHEKNEMTVPRIDEEVDIRPMRASKRFYQILQVLQACALARGDLMNGNIDELLAAPLLYLARKSNNFHTNGAKRLKLSNKITDEYVNHRRTAVRATKQDDVTVPHYDEYPVQNEMVLARFGDAINTAQYKQLKAALAFEQGNGLQSQAEADLPNPFFHPSTHRPNDDADEDLQNDDQEGHNDDHELAKANQSRKRGRSPDDDEGDEYAPTKKSRKDDVSKTNKAAGKNKKSSSVVKSHVHPQRGQYSNRVPSGMMHGGYNAAAQYPAAPVFAGPYPPGYSHSVNNMAHLAHQYPGGGHAHQIHPGGFAPQYSNGGQPARSLHPKSQHQPIPSYSFDQALGALDPSAQFPNPVSAAAPYTSGLSDPSQDIGSALEPAFEQS